VIAFWASVGLLVAGLIVVFILGAVHGVVTAVGQSAGDVATEGAAAEALSADEVAKSHHIPDGALTLSLLNQQQPDVVWLPGDVPVPISGDRTYVSTQMASGHVVTAANFAGCVYGLTVSEASDSVISQYRLRGTGTYWALQDSSTSGAPCSADTAPTFGWQRADTNDLKQISTTAVG
jgi:hypothetical protein